jgi:aspartyl-tRNA(Asn)/glutamyl-tRNA(Gln) amidotransferase subunit B
MVLKIRHFDELRNITVSIRSKEQGNDYRYFPEPDPVPLRTVDWASEVMVQLPEIPDAKRERFRVQCTRSRDDAVLRALR